MCIIIYRPSGIRLDEAILRESFHNNPDGAGFSVVDGDSLVTVKGFFLKDIDKMLKQIRKHEGKEMLIHFRIASPSMAISKDQCHPFVFDSGPDFCNDETDPIMTDEENPRPRFQFAVAHNGRLPYTHNEKQSDTSLFVAEVLQPILTRDPHAFSAVLASKYLLQCTVGIRNKLVIMGWDVQDKELFTVFVNRAEGVVAHGCWFSNSSYIKRAYLFDDNEDWRFQRGRHSSYGYNGDYNPAHHSLDKNGWYYDHTRKGYVHLVTKFFATDHIARDNKQREFERNRAEALEGKAATPTGNPDPDSVVPMAYLSVAERGIVRRMAYHWSIKALGASSRFTINESLASMRDAVRGVKPELVTDREIDNWVIELDFSKTDLYEELEDTKRDTALAEDKRRAPPLGEVIPIEADVVPDAPS